MSTPKTTVVIPTYNERENLPGLLTRIAALRIPHLDVLVVDDHSPDGTGEVAESLREQGAKDGTIAIRVLHRAQKEGLGAAYVAGFTQALADGAEIVVQVDADGSHAPEAITPMLAAITQQHADLVIGSRGVRGGRVVGWGWHRRGMSAGAQWTTRRMLGLHTRDITSGFRAWRASLLRTVLTEHIPSRGYAFQETMLYYAERSRALVTEIPITFCDRTHGHSKLGWRDVIEFFQSMLQIWRHEGALPRTDGIITWSRLPRTERRFALLLGIALVLITGFPYLYGWLRTPPGQTFTSLHAISGGDMHVYYSYIEQAREGRFVFDDLYTSESTGGSMIQPHWLVVGWIARLLHLSAPVAFHVVRSLLIIPYIGFLAVCTGTILQRSIGGFSVSTLRRAALVFLAFASGIGGLVGNFVLPFAHEGRGYSAWILDFWVPEAFTFLTIYQSSHFIISTWLMLTVYLATIRADYTHQLRWTAMGAGAAALLFIIHPFYLPSVIAIVGAYALVRMAAQRQWLTHLIRHAVWIGLAGLPTLAYWGSLTLLDPIHQSRAAQNLLLMPPLPYVLMGYGFLLPAAIIGVVHIIRRWHTGTIPEQFLAIWMISNTALLWAPLDWQRRFTQGLHVALVLASVMAIARGISWLHRRLPAAWVPIVCSRATAVTLFVLCFGFTNIINIARDLVYYASPLPSGVPKYTFYYPTAGFAAMEWMRTHTRNDAIALVPGISANFFPGRAVRRVYLAHFVETAHFEKKIAAFDTFLAPTTATSARRAFLADHDIQYLFVPQFDALAPTLTAIAQHLELPKAYENSAVTIFSVPKSEERPLQ